MQRRPFLKLAGLSLLGFDGFRAAARPAATRRVQGIATGAWTIVLLPDTQCYSESFPDVFMSQTEWIVRERQARNIQFVLHLGDITNNNTHPEWINAQRAMDVLRRAGVPYLMASGNHDLGAWGKAGDRRSHFSDYFIQKNCRVLGESENAYQTVTVGEGKFLLLALEFGPRDAVVAWANEIIAKHPDHHAILVTHAYLYHDDTRYDWKTKGRAQGSNPHNYGIATSTAGRTHEGLNDGEALWQQLVSQHPQFVLAFNGHVVGDGTGYLASKGKHGTVHQMLINYQCGVVPSRRNGGGGFLRLLEVQADGRTVQVRDYSPYYDEWLRDPDRQFAITLDLSLNSLFRA